MMTIKEITEILDQDFQPEREAAFMIFEKPADIDEDAWIAFNLFLCGTDEKRKLNLINQAYNMFMEEWRERGK